MVKRTSKITQPKIVGTNVPSSQDGSSLSQAVGEIGKFIQAIHEDKIVRDRTGAENYENTLKLSVENNIDRIASETPNNPGAIKTKSEGFISGLLEQVPEELRDLTKERARKLLNVAIAKANKNSIGISQNEAAAKETIQQSTELALNKSSSEGLYSTNPDLKNASEQQVEVLRNDLLTRLSKHIIGVDGEPVPLFPPAEAAKYITNFNDVSQSAAIEGWFDSQPTQGTALLTLMEGDGPEAAVFQGEEQEDGTISGTSFRVIPAIDLLSDGARESLIKKLSNKMKFRNTLEDKAEAEDAAAKVLVQEDTAGDNWLKIRALPAGATPVTAESLNAQRESGLLAEKDFEAQLKVITEEDPLENNSDIYDEIDKKIDLGEDALELINDAQVKDMLTDETAAAFREENRQNLDKTRSSLDKRVTDAVSNAKKDVNTLLTTNTLLSIIDFDEGPRKVRARQELRRRIDSLRTEIPVSNEEELALFKQKITDISNDVGRTFQFNRNAINKPIPNSVNAVSPEQITKDKLKDAFFDLTKKLKNKAITQQEFDTQARQLMQEDLLLNKKEAK